MINHGLSTQLVALSLIRIAVSSPSGEPSGFCTIPSGSFLPFNLLSQSPWWQIGTSSPEPGYYPWTHAPYCVQGSKAEQRLCAFTNADYHFGQGISLITTPQIAANLVSQQLLVTSRYDRPKPEVAVKYEAIRKPSSGIGLYVKQLERIRAGETILVDYPTLVVPNQVLSPSLRPWLHELQWRGVLQLPADARARTRGLAKSKMGILDEIDNVIATNAFTHEKGGGVLDMTYIEAPRINHACRPNALTRTNHSTLAMEVIALRDIPAGAQITVSYLDASVEITSSERRARISSEWNFECGCPICQGDGAAQSDVRRHEISRVRQLLFAARGNAEEILEHVTVLLDLYEQEGMIMPMAEHHQLAAYAANQLRREALALRHAAESRRYWTITMGARSQEVRSMEEFERDPGRHPSRPGARPS